MARFGARRWCAVVVAVLAATTATAGSSRAAVSAKAAASTGFANGMIAYSCAGAAGVYGNDGWVASDVKGQSPRFVHWPWGDYWGGVDWAPDGSEMLHDASAGNPAPGSGHTVFLSEANSGYPWKSTDFQDAPGVYDAQETFAPDARTILFTRNTMSTHRIEVIPAGGADPPVELPQPPGENWLPSESVNGDIVFENVAPSGPDANQLVIWILYSGSDTPVRLRPGYKPKFSPDGSLISFIDTAASSLFTMTTDGGSVTPVGPTTYAAPLNDYAWSPDGTTFVLGLSTTHGSVATAPVTPGAVVTSVPSYYCLNRAVDVSWQPVPTTPDQVVRVWGSTRENTSVAVSRASFPADHTASAVVLADSYHFPDALSGAALAAATSGTLLLTPGSQTTVLQPVMDEIERALLPQSRQVYVLGGTGSVSQGIEDDLVAHGLTVTRLAGANRYETSVAIANAMAVWPEQIFLATGTDFPDGLSAGAAAASYWGPGGGGGVVLLTNGATMPASVSQYIADAIANATPSHPVTVTTVGGLADKAYHSKNKISCVGADRYETSACVAEVHFGAGPVVSLASGTSFPDALSGGAFAGSVNAPLLLAPPSLLTSNEVPYFLSATSGAISTAYVFGGSGVVTSTQLSQLGAIIGLHTGYGQITPTSTLSAATRALVQAAPVAKRGPSAPANRRAE